MRRHELSPNRALHLGEVAEWSTNSPGANSDRWRAGPERRARRVSLRDEANNAPA